MILEQGEKLLVSNRRLFERDEPRYFVGEVAAYDSGVVKVDGYSFVRDVASGKVIRKEDLRTKIFSLNAAGYLVYLLPYSTKVDQLGFESHEGNLVLTDGNDCRMNMAERSHQGQI